MQPDDEEEIELPDWLLNEPDPFAEEDSALAAMDPEPSAQTASPEARANRGWFVKGHDPRRHALTQEEKLRGYHNALEAICLAKSCGEYWGRRWLFRRMCRTEAVRYGNPDLQVQEPIRFVKHQTEQVKEWEQAKDAKLRSRRKQQK